MKRLHKGRGFPSHWKKTCYIWTYCPQVLWSSVIHNPDQALRADTGDIRINKYLQVMGHCQRIKAMRQFFSIKKKKQNVRSTMILRNLIFRNFQVLSFCCCKPGIRLTLWLSSTLSLMLSVTKNTFSQVGALLFTLKLAFLLILLCSITLWIHIEWMWWKYNTQC